MVSRRKFSSDFKSRVALEALREESTLSELSKKYNIHPNQISHWKKQAIEGLKDTFSSSYDRDKVNHEDEVKELHAKIGQLTVERDFLVSASKRLGIGGGKKW
jgi:transposase